MANIGKPKRVHEIPKPTTTPAPATVPVQPQRVPVPG